MNILIIEMDKTYGFATRIDKKWFLADKIYGKVNENCYQLLKDRTNLIPQGKFFTKEDVFLEEL